MACLMEGIQVELEVLLDLGEEDLQKNLEGGMEALPDMDLNSEGGSLAPELEGTDLNFVMDKEGILLERGIQTLETSRPQCGNLRIFLPTRFYVKSMLANRQSKKLQF